MSYVIRPLGPWLDLVTKDRRSKWIFKATWTDTEKLLHYELSHLRAQNVVLGIVAALVRIYDIFAPRPFHPLSQEVLGMPRKVGIGAEK